MASVFVDMGPNLESPPEPPVIDWLRVLRRLCAFARQRLVFDSALKNIAGSYLPGLGYGTLHIASDVWGDAYTGKKPLPDGPLDTDQVVCVLIDRLKRRFLDETRRERGGRTVMVWETQASVDDIGENLVAVDAGILERIEHRELVDWLLETSRRRGDTAVARYLQLQFPEGEGMGYTREEAAAILGVTPADVTNLYKRIQTMLKKRAR